MIGLKREPEQQFSTFVKIANGDFKGWIEDGRLKRNLEKEKTVLQWDSEQPFPASFWVAHWHQHWKSEQIRLPRYHLYAYLQEPCYWTAKTISHRFNTTTFGLGDCFQAASEKFDSVLEHFKPELGTSLSTYASRAFTNALKDTLGQYNEVQISSELSLLQRCGSKRLGEALTAAGLPPATQATHKAAWRSFKAFYFPRATTARSLASLVPEDWAMMAAYYEALRAQNKLDAADGTQLQAWLADCVLYLRRYVSPQSLSLNAHLDDSQEFIDQLGETQEESMALLIAQEQEAARQQQQRAVTAVLRSGLSQLNPSSQQILKLYYGDALKQAEIAVQLDSEQYKISRQLRSARKALLKVLVTWSLEELHISCDAAVLNNMTVILEDWLKCQFSGRAQ